MIFNVGVYSSLLHINKTYAAWDATDTAEKGPQQCLIVKLRVFLGEALVRDKTRKGHNSMHPHGTENTQGSHKRVAANFQLQM